MSFLEGMATLYSIQMRHGIFPFPQRWSILTPLGRPVQPNAVVYARTCLRCDGDKRELYVPRASSIEPRPIECNGCDATGYDIIYMSLCELDPEIQRQFIAFWSRAEVIDE